MKRLDFSLLPQNFIIRILSAEEAAYHGKCYYLLNGHNFVTYGMKWPKMKRKKFYWKNRKARRD